MRCDQRQTILDRIRTGEPLHMQLTDRGRAWWLETPYTIVPDHVALALISDEDAGIAATGDSLFGMHLSSQTYIAEDTTARRSRIRAKIMARVEIDEVTGCYNWTGPTSGNTGRGKGYPRMSLDGQTVAVHLVMWTNEHGYVPGKKQLDHVCRNRRCVRPHPDHLELVTPKTNARRREDARRAAKDGTDDQTQI